ncbi:hypothetical protein Tco_1437724 [Tanacetum coccineum]
MCTYLKNMEGYKLKDLKLKEFDSIQEMFDRAFKRARDKVKGIMVEPEVPLKMKDQVALDEEMARNMEAQLQAKLIEEERIASQKEEEANIALLESWDNIQAMMEGDFKLAQRLQAEEQQKGDDDQEEAEMKRHIEIVKDDEVANDAIPLATKPLVIVDYKIDKDGKTLWKLVKAKYENTRPKDDYERVLWGGLKVMFEHDIKSDVWRNLQGYKVIVWKLFDNCGVHFVPSALCFATEGLCFALGTKIELPPWLPFHFLLVLVFSNTLFSCCSTQFIESRAMRSLADPQVSTLSRQISTSYFKALTLVTKISRSTLSYLISGITLLVPLSIDTIFSKSLTGAAMTEVSGMTTSGDGGSTVGGGNGSGDSRISDVVRKRYESVTPEKFHSGKITGVV